MADEGQTSYVTVHISRGLFKAGKFPISRPSLINLSPLAPFLAPPTGDGPQHLSIERTITPQRSLPYDLIHLPRRRALGDNIVHETMLSEDFQRALTDNVRFGENRGSRVSLVQDVINTQVREEYRQAEPAS